MVLRTYKERPTGVEYRLGNGVICSRMVSKWVARLLSQKLSDTQMFKVVVRLWEVVWLMVMVYSR